VAAVYGNGDLVGDHVVGLPVFEANLAGALDGRVLIDRAAGVGADQARTAIERVVADYPSATLLDQDQLERAQSAQIDQVLNFVYILLALAVVVALLGITNTLSLATLERTRELGLLRAVGMTRRQVRASVRLESVIVALLGTVLGTAIAVFLGWAMVTTVAGDGATFVVPAIQLGAIALAAALAGVLAAVLPARRAARLDVLAAVATE
jgi:putative ABC transport system permease protein